MFRNANKNIVSTNRAHIYQEYESTIYALTAAIDAKDHYTFSHSTNVAYYATALATALGMNEDMVEIIRQAALLHDVGKIGIPEYILNKADKLTDDEYETIKGHVEASIDIIRHLPSLDYVIPAVIGHHERYDGTGYPDGLKGEEIPIHARIIAVADSYDAMQSRRIYRNPLGTAVIYNEILNNRGTQFDPEIADVFLKLLDENRLVINADYKGIEDEYALPAVESEIEKFISNVMTTMRTQEDSEGFDFLTGLPMRNRGEKLAAQFGGDREECTVIRYRERVLYASEGWKPEEDWDEKNANIHIGRKERNRKEFSCNGFMPERKY